MGSSVEYLIFHLVYLNSFVSGNNLTSRSEVVPADSVSDLLDILYLTEIVLVDITIGFKEEKTKKSFFLRSKKEMKGITVLIYLLFLLIKNL